MKLVRGRLHPDSLLRRETRIRRQIDGIERILGLKHRQRILDLGCGAGAQTIELARRRYRIVGMDRSAAAFAEARAQAREQDLTAHFVADDMYRIPYRDEFNAVLNVRNPLGCHADERDDIRCLEAVHRSLRPGGKMLLDLINREFMVRHIGPHSRTFDLSSGRLEIGGFHVRGGKPSYMGRSIRLYSLREIIRMFAEAGIRFREVFGGYDGRAYGLDSLRMIAIGEKGPEPQRPRVRKRDSFDRAIRIKGRPR